eukprot:COSAG01_NODE_7810_length_3046_cov_26.887343_4_plen_129_part_00
MMRGGTSSSSREGPPAATDAASQALRPLRHAGTTDQPRPPQDKKPREAGLQRAHAVWSQAVVSSLGDGALHGASCTAARQAKPGRREREREREREERCHREQDEGRPGRRVPEQMTRQTPQQVTAGRV